MSTKTSFAVKYTEIDSLGIVHHSNYPIWFEAGRRDFFRKAGTPNHDLKKQGLFLPLTEMKCAYKSPARFGNEIQVITSLIYLSCVKVKFEYKILNKSDGKILATGMTVHAWTDKKIEPINMEKKAPEVYMHLKRLVESKEIPHTRNVFLPRTM